MHDPKPEALKAALRKLITAEAALNIAMNDHHTATLAVRHALKEICEEEPLAQGPWLCEGKLITNAEAHECIVISTQFTVKDVHQV